MIELKDNGLEFRFPEMHPEACLGISLLRTLRVPDDGKTYPLPPGLGRFSMQHVDDHAGRIPDEWIEHGGVMLPMYQSEAMWICFRAEHIARRGDYPFAVRVAAGKVDAVTGELWSEGLDFAEQNYLVAPPQPWIDGFCVEKGTVRQFVAMPLGQGATAEEQLTGLAQNGGIQIEVRPMRREAFERRFPEREPRREMVLDGLGLSVLGCASGMGLAPGGKIRQQLHPDPYDPSDWDEGVSSRCFLHIANSAQWQSMTGERPGRRAPDAKTYTDAGLPWFTDYDEKTPALGGSKKLRGLSSIGKQVREGPSFEPKNVVDLRRRLAPGQVREGV